MTKNVQVFTRKGGEFCEINADLVSITYGATGLSLKTKEAGDTTTWEHFFPYWNVRMVRISSHA